MNYKHNRNELLSYYEKEKINNDIISKLKNTKPRNVSLQGWVKILLDTYRKEKDSNSSIQYIYHDKKMVLPPDNIKPFFDSILNKINELINTVNKIQEQLKTRNNIND